MARLEWTGERDREAVLAIVVVRGGYEVRERRHALRGKPIEPGRCLDGTQHEKMARTRERQGAGRQWLPPLREIDEACLDRIESDTRAGSKRRFDQSMQTAVAARHGSEARKARGAKAGFGEGLQRDAVIGAAEPGAPERGERRARLRRIENGVAREARLGGRVVRA